MAGNVHSRLSEDIAVKVLIAVDGSKESATAVETAARLLRCAERNIDLLSIAPKVPLAKRLLESGAAAHHSRYELRAMRELTQILEQARTSLAGNRGEIRLLKQFGSPAPVIVGRAEDYDLTVIGSKGRGTSGDVALGPVASRVVEYALAPVLLARELRSEEGFRVLAAVDGSTAALHALETLCELFDLRSAEVCLMHVTETPWVEPAEGDEFLTYSEEDKEQSETGAIEEELTREGSDVIEQAREVLRPYRVSVLTRMDQGNPANEILSEAERGQYDLVIAGATGVRDLKHSMLGSVSAKIAWNAPCSVLVVREPA